MIDEQILLCAFAYAEYESDNNTSLLCREQKQEYMNFCTEYIKTQQNYPEQAIEPMLQRMKLLNISDPRDYVYSGHFRTIINSIEKKTRKGFYKSVKNPLVMRIAMNCPANLYNVISVRKNQIIGQNMITKRKNELTTLDGLEIPKPNQIISGHWNYSLEIIKEGILLRKYLPRLSAYLMNIKENLI